MKLRWTSDIGTSFLPNTLVFQSLIISLMHLSTSQGWYNRPISSCIPWESPLSRNYELHTNKRMGVGEFRIYTTSCINLKTDLLPTNRILSVRPAGAIK